MQGLKPRQMAVLFRNNHFSTLFKFDEALYLLVTDQGYLHEQVWLQACSSSPWHFASQRAQALIRLSGFCQGATVAPCK